jgi:hypothetical protein
VIWTHKVIVLTWAGAQSRIAVCPIVEGALTRYLARGGAPVTTSLALLAGLRATERCDFWPDDVSYVDADLSHVTGHRQVTDAYLVALARRHDAKLATLDQPLAAIFPDHTHLIPPRQQPAKGSPQ